MGERLEVERLDGPTAASLAARLAEELGERADVNAHADGRVDVETRGASVAELLNAVEEWTAASGLGALRVRLNGRAYVLECPRPAESPPGPASTAPAL